MYGRFDFCFSVMPIDPTYSMPSLGCREERDGEGLVYFGRPDFGY